MRQIEIEVNGKKQTVTREQLRMLLSRRIINLETIVWIDGKEFKIADLAARLSTREKTNATDVPVDQTVKPETDEVPSPQNATPKKSRKALVVWIIGLVVVAGVITSNVIVRFNEARKSKPSAEEPVANVAVENSAVGESETKQTETEISTEFGREPFDRSWESIPSSYKGSSFPELCYNIDQLYSQREKQPPQGEFEKTKDFLARMQQEDKDLEGRPISGNIAFGSTVAFPLIPGEELRKSPCFTYRYGADSGTWTFAIDFPVIPSSYLIDDILIPLWSDVKTEDGPMYLLVDGERKKFNVTTSFYSTGGIWLEAPDKQGFSPRFDSFSPRYGETFNLFLNNVPSDFAKEKKGKLSGFCVCDIVPRRPFQEEKKQEPKSSSSSNSIYIGIEFCDYIRAKNLEFWFYDETTREVVAKFSLAEMYSEKPKDFADAKTVLDRSEASSSSSDVADNSDSETQDTQSQDDDNESNATAYSDAPFDSSISAIPVDYQGHNLLTVVNALSQPKFRLSETEFSSLDEYRKWFQRRADSLATESLYGSLTFGSKLAYVMKNVAEANNAQEAISTEYQESTKTMTIRRSFKYSRSDYKVESSKNAGWLGGGVFGEYNSANSSNSSESLPDVFFSLALRDEEVYGLALENKRPDPQFDCWTLTGVSSEDYNRLKNSIRVLCLFQLGANGSEYSGFYKSSNFALAHPSYALCTTNPEFWLYDKSTGVILAKYTAKDFFNGRRLALGKAAKGGTKENLDGEIAEELEQPTWDDVLREAVDSPEKWEAKAPTITVPDDAKSLEEALAKTSKGDVILVRPSERPIPLKSKKALRGESSEVTIDHAVAIVGESDSSENVVVEVGSEETLRIDSRDLVAFKGVTFSFRNTPSADDITPLVVVSNDSKAKFKNCVFKGNGAEKSAGIVVEGEFAVTTFWKCNFQQFGDAGLRVQDSAKATLEYCQFLSENRYGVSSFSGAAIKVDKCRFDGNVTGFIAEGGGGVVASNSFFSRNRSNWSISSGSRSASDTKEGNIVEK